MSSVKGSLPKGSLGMEQPAPTKGSAVHRKGPEPSGSVNKGSLPTGSLGKEQPGPVAKSSATHKG